jgi:hypothetical protein
MTTVRAVIASVARQSTSPTPEAMDRHGLRPRDDEKGAVIASVARQSMAPLPQRWIAAACGLAMTAVAWLPYQFYPWVWFWG